ncbi:MAG: hypothetical protein Q8P81_02525 [Nanoarchaeota archaeon]|nr:hypothetical protein [Nanoarchaeota archaeon]
MNLRYFGLASLLVVFLFASVSMVSALETEFLKQSDTFDKGETLIARISGNFVDRINVENVLFYKDHVRIPMEYDVGKINDDFYVYALLLNKPSGNYSLRINDVRYIDILEIKNGDIIMNFTITPQTADFYMNPGFIISDGDFSFEVQNLKGEKSRIQVNGHESFIYEPYIDLVPGSTKRVNFILNDSDQVMGNVNFSSENTRYTIPVLAGTPDNSDAPKVSSFKFEPSVVDLSMATNSSSNKIIYLVNDGDNDLGEISFSLSPSLAPYVTITPKSITNLKKYSVEKIELFILSGSEAGSLFGEITASTDNIESTFPVSLSFVPNYVPSENNSGSIITTCSQLGGLICGDNEVCTESTLPTRDGLCCPSQARCERIVESSTGKVIGWGMILIALALLTWFFRKYKRVRPKMDLLSIAGDKK